MSDTSQVQVRIYEEVSWGEDPSTSNKMSDLNIVSADLKAEVRKKSSDVIRSDGNNKSISLIGKGASGSMGYELAHKELETIFAGLLRSDYSTPLDVTAATISATDIGNTIDDSGSGFGDAVVGQWVRVSGFLGDPLNNGFAKVTAATAAQLTLSAIDLSDEALGNPITVEGRFLVNGIAEKSFLIEQQFSAADFEYFTGMEVVSCTFNFVLDDHVKVTSEWLGKEGFRAVTTQGDGSPNPAETTQSMGVVDALSFYIDNTLTVEDVVSFNVTATPVLRTQNAITARGLAVGIGSGTFNVTGTLEVHNENNDLLSDMDGFETKSLTVIVGDTDGNNIVLDFPACKLSDGTRAVPGQDQDVITSIQFETLLDETIAGQMGITIIDAL